MTDRINPDTMPELKPCPFCGDAPYHETSKSHVSGELYHFIECRSLRCPVRPKVSATKGTYDDLEDWNTRSDLVPRQAVPCPDLNALIDIAHGMYDLEDGFRVDPKQLCDVLNEMRKFSPGQAVTGDAIDAGPINEQYEENSGFWHPCSGCHETEDGHDVGHYPYSNIFRCKMGGGCSECGGLGVIWDNNDYEALAKDMAHPRPAVSEDATAIKALDDLSWFIGYASAAPHVDGSEGHKKAIKAVATIRKLLEEK